MQVAPLQGAVMRSLRVHILVLQCAVGAGSSCHLLLFKVRRLQSCRRASWAEAFKHDWLMAAAFCNTPFLQMPASYRVCRGLDQCQTTWAPSLSSCSYTH